jgi:hypothetical protein
MEDSLEKYLHQWLDTRVVNSENGLFNIDGYNCKSVLDIEIDGWKKQSTGDSKNVYSNPYFPSVTAIEILLRGLLEGKFVTISPIQETTGEQVEKLPVVTISRGKTVLLSKKKTYVRSDNPSPIIPHREPDLYFNFMSGELPLPLPLPLPPTKNYLICGCYGNRMCPCMHSSYTNSCGCFPII